MAGRQTAPAMPPRVRTKAQRLARARVTQIWLVVSPAQAQRLVDGTVPRAVRDMAELCLLAPPVGKETT